MSDLKPTLVGIAASWQPLARLYAISTLDPIIEIARALANDATTHPHRYREIPDDVGEILAAFRSRFGTDPQWPNAAQRDQMYASLLGVSFSSACASLRTAAVTIVEQPQNPTAPLRSAFLEAVATSLAFFKTLDGPVLASALRQTEAVFASAIRVFQTQSLAAGFGIKPAPNGWPFDESADGDAASLIEIQAEALGLAGRRPLITRHRFLRLQRAAFNGAKLLTKLLNGDSVAQQGDEADVVLAAYLWEQALQNLLFGLDVRRTLKDAVYRQSLSRAEQSLLPPHPSGNVSVEGTELDSKVATALVRRGFSTLTVRSICCCTGDLPCPFSSILAIGERLA